MNEEYILVLTGSSGILGQKVIEAAKRIDLTVETLIIRNSFLDFVSQNQSKIDKINSLKKKVILIHLGIPPVPRTKSDYKKYFNNSIELFEFSIKNEWIFCFASSLSVSKSNFSNYAQNKFLMEKHFLFRKGVVIRFGLISSPHKNSVMNRIRNCSRFLPLNYLLDEESTWYLTTKNNLDELLVQLNNLEDNDLGGILICANPKPINIVKQLNGRKANRFKLLGQKNLLSLYLIFTKISFFDSLRNLRFGMRWNQSE